MKKKDSENLSDVEKQGAFSRLRNSIRTRYSLLTAVFLLAALSSFYIGGRIVLVHLVRDTELQMRDLGFDVRRTVENGPSETGMPRDEAEPDAIDTAFDFYSGGFWNTSDIPIIIELPIRIENGKVVETAKVSFPRLFSEVTRSAIWRLLFAVAVAGILFVLPLFWFQGRILLNPLTKMTKEIAALGLHNEDVDCPRLVWNGKDEFAMLAVSVNRMLETISRRSVSVAQAESMHQALIDGIPDSLAIFDQHGSLVAITKESDSSDPMPGLRTGEPPSAAVFGEGPVSQFRKTLREVFENGGVGVVRLRVARPLGMSVVDPTRVFELRLSRLGERFIMSIVRDISDVVREHRLRISAEARVKDIEKRESLTLLAAGIAHDMNNVLSVVLGAAEAQEAGSTDPAETVATIRDAVRRGNSMMRELMTFAGENKIALKRLGPKLIIDDVKILADRAVGGNIILDYDCDADAPDVDADPGQFWKVLFNIVKNAGEAIKDRPGHVMVSASRCVMTSELADEFTSSKPLEEGVGTMFMISDNGPGIPADLLPRIFDPYVSSKSVGRGLGLATVCTIVEAHGGGIAVKSLPERGTIFRIFLPESKLPETEGEMPKPAEGPRTDSLSGEVLVVDDEERILRTTSILLKSMKLQPFTAKDNQEALAIVRRRSDTLRAIILDADLGGVDTVRLLGVFRVSAPGVPVIVTSGSAEELISKLFAAEPYDAFLAKPFTVVELKDAVKSAKRTI